MGFYSPPELVDVTIEKGVDKAKASVLTLSVLGFAAGMFIGLAGIAFIRAMGTMPAEWGSLVLLIGACVFPFGLICLLLAGGELVTGNMMVVSMALFAKRITGKEWLRNIAIVTIFNFIGAFFVAYFFGHLAGALQGDFAARTILVAQGRTKDDFLQAFLSGIACNILVSTGVYLNFAAKDFMGKIAGIWLPIMGFVMSGFQHVVANMFIIPAGILAGGVTWGDFWMNMIPVFLGNVIGGGGFIAFMYFAAYKIGTGKNASSK
ncbi:formate/nitrite transporter family protein [Carnobacterium gallinarum]|uniref:formate/nitrite transporter family protein n=1 Tax=Carnobacterium gallinarum TaxID=2749 RepID=UPI0005508388|nr:formate/nitrite transporter family protein [Carnobacterium gallinarum]